MTDLTKQNFCLRVTGMQQMINQIKAKVFNRKGANYSFAQAGEDLVLQRIFLGASPGFYIDVGAYHPYKLSNTYLFYLNGWRGINIEPRPHSKKLFDRVRPLDVNLELGIAEQPGQQHYYVFGESTLNQFDFAGAANTPAKFTEIVKIRVERLSTILEHHIEKNRTIDFITIDTEGAEYQVLKSMNWRDFDIKVVLIEQNKSNKTFEDVHRLLISKGYQEAYRIPVNVQADSVFYIIK